MLLPLLPALPEVAYGQSNEVVREEARNLYHLVPDVPVSLVGGHEAHLSDLWRDKPLLITLFYRRCTGTCSPFLRSLQAAIEKSGGLGKDYRVISLSFDPQDTVEDVQAMAEALDIHDRQNWLFGIGAPEDIERVADAIGFWYKKDAVTDQFDHPSLIAAVRGGRIIRVLLGTTVNPSRLKEALFELKGVFVPVYALPGEDVLFRCLEFAGVSQQVRFSWGMLLLFLPGGMALLAAVAVFGSTRRSNNVG